VLARNPNSPYPVYQTLKKADGFSLPGLFAAVKHLSETDRRIKSTGQEPRLLLEAFLIGLRRNQGQTPNGPGE
jgi:DNA polymerase-3 subunit delta